MHWEHCTFCCYFEHNCIFHVQQSICPQKSVVLKHWKKAEIDSAVMWEEAFPKWNEKKSEPISKEKRQSNMKSRFMLTKIIKKHLMGITRECDTKGGHHNGEGTRGRKKKKKRNTKFSPELLLPSQSGRGITIYNQRYNHLGSLTWQTFLKKWDKTQELRTSVQT